MFENIFKAKKETPVDDESGGGGGAAGEGPERERDATGQAPERGSFTATEYYSNPDTGVIMTEDEYRDYMRGKREGLF